MPIILPQRPVLSQGDIDVCSVDFQDWLDNDETLTGTPTVTEVTTADLTLSNKQVNTVPVYIDGRYVGTGKAVQWKVSGQLSGRTYTIQVTTTSNAAVPRTKVVYCKFRVE